MNPMVISSDGDEYYAYILLYVDDILCIRHDAESVITKFDKYFKLKPDSVGEPDMYLGAKVRPMKLENGVWAWILIFSQYVQESYCNVQKYVKENLGGVYKLSKQVPNLFAMVYAPELDSYTVLDHSLASYYQSQIVFFRWMVEHGD